LKGRWEAGGKMTKECKDLRVRGNRDKKYGVANNIKEIENDGRKTGECG